MFLLIVESFLGEKPAFSLAYQYRSNKCDSKLGSIDSSSAVCAEILFI
jgi:hypothetical protein